MNPNSSRVSFTTLLPAIRYPLGVSLGAGRTNPQGVSLGPGEDGESDPGYVKYWILPCAPHKDKYNPEIEYEVPAVEKTAGPRFIKVQSFAYENKKYLKPNGVAWPVKVAAAEVLSAREPPCILVKCPL